MRVPVTSENVNTLTQIAQVQCGWITQVAWSPDGATLAVAGAEGIRLYVGSFGGAPTHVLEGHTGHVKGAVFSPANRIGLLLASWASDMTVKIWDAGDLKAGVREIATLHGHTDSVDDAAFSPDADRLMLASASADGTIRIWDLDRMEEKAVLSGHDQEVTSVTYALSGHVLVSGGRDHTVRLWDVESETEGTVFGHHDDWVREIRVNPPGTMIASASKDTSLRLWDAHSGELYARVYAHAEGADCVAFSPDGALMVTGGRDNTVRLWDVERILQQGHGTVEDAILEIRAHDKPVLSVAFHPGGTMLASASGDNTVKLWAVE
jgi:WD40 repeat protein